MATLHKLFPGILPTGKAETEAVRYNVFFQDHLRSKERQELKPSAYLLAMILAFSISIASQEIKVH